MTQVVGKAIMFEDEKWLVIAVGAQTEDDVYCHLTSLRRFIRQWDGYHPEQYAGWVSKQVLNKARGVYEGE